MSIEQLFERFPILAGERIILRKINRNDSKALWHLYSDELVMQHLDRFCHTLEEAQAMVDYYIEGYRQKQLIRWAITLRNAGQLIGTCGFHDIDAENKRLELGYDLASQYWRQGLMSEALHLLIQFGFNQLGLHRIEAITAPENIASQHILKHLGFTQEGILRDRCYHKETFIHDVMFGLLSHEYHRS